MPTPQRIINLAAKDAGILGQGQTLSAEETMDAYDTLNDMVSQWQRKRWLVYHLVDLSVVSTGAQSYSVGPAPANIQISPRPDRLEYAYNRQLINSTPNQADYTLRILESREDYSSIVMKKIGNFPYCIFYDTDWPNGTIYPYPVPLANLYEIHIIVKAVLSTFTSLSQQITLPPEYNAALRWQLALRLCPSHGREPSKMLLGLAREGLQVIRGANMQVKRLTMPSELLRPAVYNPYSDQIQ